MELRCECGKKYRVAEGAHGKRLRCRDCGAELVVPRSIFEDDDQASSGPAEYAIARADRGATQPPVLRRQPYAPDARDDEAADDFAVRPLAVRGAGLAVFLATIGNCIYQFSTAPAQPNGGPPMSTLAWGILPIPILGLVGLYIAAVGEEPDPEIRRANRMRGLVKCGIGLGMIVLAGILTVVVTLVAAQLAGRFVVFHGLMLAGAGTFIYGALTILTGRQLGSRSSPVASSGPASGRSRRWESGSPPQWLILLLGGGAAAVVLAIVAVVFWPQGAKQEVVVQDPKFQPPAMPRLPAMPAPAQPQLPKRPQFQRPDGQRPEMQKPGIQRPAPITLPVPMPGRGGPNPFPGAGGAPVGPGMAPPVTPPEGPVIPPPGPNGRRQGPRFGRGMPGRRAADRGTPTEIVGGSGGIPFRSASDEGPLLGFTATLGTWAGQSAISQLQPLFKQPDSGAQAKAIVAREGYAVRALEVDAQSLVNAVRVVFGKVNSDGTTEGNDTYTSEWIGTPTGRATRTIDSQGRKVVGLHGRRGAVVDGIGLVLE